MIPAERRAISLDRHEFARVLMDDLRRMIEAIALGMPPEIIVEVRVP
jgi:hypothetical protein